MQKRTRIFAVVTVLTGLLLGLGVLLSFATKTPAGAASAKKRLPHHRTTTITSTVVIPRPSPFCFASPNRVTLQKTIGTIGNTSFTVTCKNMSPNATVTIAIVNNACTEGGFTPTTVLPAGNGVFTSQFNGIKCTTGTFTISVGSTHTTVTFV